MEPEQSIAISVRPSEAWHVGQRTIDGITQPAKHLLTLAIRHIGLFQRIQCRAETERHHQRAPDEIFVGEQFHRVIRQLRSLFQDVAQVSQEREVPDPAFADQFRPCAGFLFSFVRVGLRRLAGLGELRLPRRRRCERSRHEFADGFRVRRVNQVHRVDEFQSGTAAAVLRQLVGIKTGQRLTEPFFQGVRQRFPVNGHAVGEDFEDVVHAEDHAVKESLRPFGTLHVVGDFAGNEVRHRAHAGLAAGVERRFGDELLIRILRNQLRQPFRGIVTATVELVLEKTRQHEGHEFEFLRLAVSLAARKIERVRPLFLAFE